MKKTKKIATALLMYMIIFSFTSEDVMANDVSFSWSNSYPVDTVADGIIPGDTNDDKGDNDAGSNVITANDQAYKPVNGSTADNRHQLPSEFDTENKPDIKESNQNGGKNENISADNEKNQGTSSGQVEPVKEIPVTETAVTEPAKETSVTEATVTEPVKETPVTEATVTESVRDTPAEEAVITESVKDTFDKDADKDYAPSPATVVNSQTFITDEDSSADKRHMLSTEINTEDTSKLNLEQISSRAGIYDFPDEGVSFTLWSVPSLVLFITFALFAAGIKRIAK